MADAKGGGLKARAFGLDHDAFVAAMGAVTVGIVEAASQGTIAAPDASSHPDVGGGFHFSDFLDLSAWAMPTPPPILTTFWTGAQGQSLTRLWYAFVEPNEIGATYFTNPDQGLERKVDRWAESVAGFFYDYPTNLNDGAWRSGVANAAIDARNKLQALRQEVASLRVWRKGGKGKA